VHADDEKIALEDWIGSTFGDPVISYVANPIMTAPPRRLPSTRRTSASSTLPPDANIDKDGVFRILEEAGDREFQHAHE